MPCYKGEFVPEFIQSLRLEWPIGTIQATFNSLHVPISKQRNAAGVDFAYSSAGMSNSDQPCESY